MIKPNNNIPAEQISWFTNEYIRSRRSPGIVIDGKMPFIIGGERRLVIDGPPMSRMGKVMMNPDSLPEFLDEAITEAARLEYYEMAATLRALLNELMLAMDDDSPIKLVELIARVKKELL